MNKSELVEALSKDMNVSVAIGSGIVNTIINSISENLEKGENIEICGLGAFTVRHKDRTTT